MRLRNPQRIAALHGVFELFPRADKGHLREEVALNDCLDRILVRVLIERLLLQRIAWPWKRRPLEAIFRH
jgi:hypothetical protein